MIEILMTIALVMYFAAYFVASHKVDGKRPSWFIYHIPVAVVAFCIDMYATYLMFMLDTEVMHWAVAAHTGITLVAVALFFGQALLGLARMREAHIIFAQYIFLPAWVISFLSGLALAFI